MHSTQFISLCADTHILIDLGDHLPITVQHLVGQLEFTLEHAAIHLCVDPPFDAIVIGIL